MVPTLIVLFLVALGVAIVAWAVRRKPSRPVGQGLDQDTAWNDPMTPADAQPDAAETAPAPADDPFAHAPPPPAPHATPGAGDGTPR